MNLSPESYEIIEESYPFYQKYCQYYFHTGATVYAVLYSIYTHDALSILKSIKAKPSFQNKHIIKKKRQKKIMRCIPYEKNVYTQKVTKQITAIWNNFYWSKQISKDSYSITPFDLFYLMYKQNKYIDGRFFNISSKIHNKEKERFEDLLDTLMTFQIYQLIDYKSGNQNSNDQNIDIKLLEKKVKAFGGTIINISNYAYNPLIGNELELKKLEKKIITGNSVAIIGESGVGKTTLVRGLAYAVHTKQVPECLKSKNIISLSTTELLSGTHYRGDLEGKMSSLLELARQNKNLIFFFDEMHSLMGGKSEKNDMNFANTLKSALSNKEIQIIGTTTSEEWDTTIAKDQAFRERFQTILLPTPEEEQMTNILLQHKNILESTYQVQFAMDKDFFTNLIHCTNAQGSIKHYETIKNPRLSLEILDDIFANAIYEETDHVTNQHITDGILENEVLTDQTKENILKHLPSEKKQDSDIQQKILKLQ